MSYLSSLSIDQSSAVPLYEQISQFFRRQIEARQLSPGTSLPTNHDLCAQLQVSYKTVQRAMTELANEGYIMRRARRGTVVKGVPRRGMIGIYCAVELLGPNSKHEYYRMLIESLSTQIQDCGQAHRIYLGNQSKDSANVASEDMLHHVSDGTLRAALITCPFTRLSDLIRIGQDRHAPIISLFNHREASYSVKVDLASYVHKAAAYLREHGCQRVGIVYNKHSRSFADPRSIQTIYHENGLAFRAEWAAARNEDEDGGYDAACSLPLNDLDGLIVGDDLMALGVDRRMCEQNISVPSSLRVTTLWNRGSRLDLQSPFTRFEVDSSEQAALCIQMMNSLIAGRRIEKHHLSVATQNPAACRTAHDPAHDDTIAEDSGGRVAALSDGTTHSASDVTAP